MLQMDAFIQGVDDGGDISLSVSHSQQMYFFLHGGNNQHLLDAGGCFVNTVLNMICCLLFHLASRPLCYHSKLAKLSPLCSPGMLTFSSLKESHAGKARRHGDKG